MTERVKPKPPESMTQCLACGYTATNSEFKGHHSRCSANILPACITIVAIAVFVWFVVC